MAITKSWEASAAAHLDLIDKFQPIERRRELFWLAGASLLVACGLASVFAAKTQDFAELQDLLNRGDLLNLNQAAGPQQVSAVLQIFASPARDDAGERIWNYIQQHRPLPNVGAIAKLRSTKLSFSKLKPLLIVRTPDEFLRIYTLWSLLYLGSFWIVHLGWRLRRFRGDPAILPALHLLTGLGLILMVSLRDPLRDTLEFKKFAWGVMLGCACLLLPLLRPFQYRNFSCWIYTPLLIAFVLFVALLAFGSGPTGSDAKVNLGPFQPVEVIKVLLVLFMAGYFARNWERLRDLHPKKLIPLRLVDIPRASHALPVMCAVACALALFFLMKDMGPALVVGFLFLAMFAVARGRFGLALLGVTLLLGVVAIGYHFGAPRTVAERVSMWLSPWDNNLRGGDQLAHSLWAFATGGPFGSGPGWGDPSVIPAGHTDLVLLATAEEWGMPGVLSVALLLALLVHRAFHIALDAPDEYALFLGIGLGALLALEMLLISGGVLGAIPLSGVVSPFLSSGNTAMLANFLIFAILLGISNQAARAGPEEAEPDAAREEIRASFRMPVRTVSLVLGSCVVALVARAAYVEALCDSAPHQPECFSNYPGWRETA